MLRAGPAAAEEQGLPPGPEGDRHRSAAAGWRWRQAAGVILTVVASVTATELARRAGSPAWLVVLAAAVPLASGTAWLDRQWGRWCRQEEDRRWLVETVLDEFRSRATAVTLAAGMLRRSRSQASGGASAVDPATPAAPAGPASPVSPATFPAVPAPASPVAPAAAARETAAIPRPRLPDPPDRPDARASLAGPGGGWGRIVPLRVQEGLPAGRFADERSHTHVLVQLEAEAELLRLSALQLACWLRLQARRVRPERERVDLAAVAERVARRLAAVALARQVQVTLAGRSGTAMVVRGDRALLELLCSSLVAAVIDRCPPGSRLEMRVDGDGAAVVLDLEAQLPAPGGDGGRPGMNPAEGRAVLLPQAVRDARPGAVAAGSRAGGPAGPAGSTAGRTGPAGGAAVGNRWRRGVTSPLALELVAAVAGLHAGRWRAAPGGLRWTVELPAAHGPFGILRSLVRPAPSPGLPASRPSPLVKARVTPGIVSPVAGLAAARAAAPRALARRATVVAPAVVPGGARVAPSPARWASPRRAGGARPLSPGGPGRPAGQAGGPAGRRHGWRPPGLRGILTRVRAVPHLSALAVKFVATAAVLLWILPAGGSMAGPGALLLLAAAVTLAGYVTGDRIVLPVGGQAVAMVVDVLLAALILAVAGYLWPALALRPGPVGLASLALGIAEFFFHRYLKTRGLARPVPGE
ncbi:DUF2512 family protein [Thermaerobacter subterraneus]|uniref:Histidine kinase n=1 Tax=Thermaerobacter subterraneus DSM 13965 TaxID=867903 RepID=K6PR53_9FIRM|nr:DUF2512 family protein [Thermaerobacter subterraneus]EKP95422.1 Protein of unknown function (DUF2512) [Thermaerobacter subterraneus DSM 13965]